MTEDLINGMVTLLVPLAVAWLKPRIVRLPKWAVPLSAILLGAFGQYLASLSGFVEANVALGVVLGGCAVGVREVADQIRKDLNR